MKKWLKILIGIIATPIVLIIAFCCYYVISNTQGVIEPFQVGNLNAEQKILIASQGSEFKNNLVSEIVNQLKDDELYLCVVDCTKLGEENVLEWDAFVIIHTTQIHGMPEEAEAFLKRIPDHSKVILVTTSGGGDEVVKGYEVDAISSASRMSVTSKILKWFINF